MNKKTGLTLLLAGGGINLLDYLTTAPPDATGFSPGGIFYGPGGFLSTFPKAGLLLIVVGGVVWLMKK